jgi:NADH-quinone oxidoreductase subunit M
MGFATAGVFYAAGLAFLQTNLRRLLAFAVVSHTGLIVMGLFTLHEPGLQGALLLSVNFGLAAAALLLMVGLVHRRTRTSRLDRLGGLFDTLPAMGVAFLAAGLAVVGMPGTPGFDAAHLVLEAAMARFGALLTVATALGNVVAAGFLLWAFQRAFLAPRAAGLPSIEPANRRELALASAIIAVLLFAGFYMEPWMTLVEMPTQALAARLGSH